LSQEPLETIPGLREIHGVRASFIGRIPGIDVAVPREEAVNRLTPVHWELLDTFLGTKLPLVTTEQVHGSSVALVDTNTTAPLLQTDGLVTTQQGVTLGIYVADCAPVWIVARDGTAGALLHSGKKGTELGITRQGIRMLADCTGKQAGAFLAIIGPCIRPPCYEVDFASEIARQAREEGIHEIHDAGICTACDPDRYYSYRREKGLTGRMLATLTLRP
jgi:copper oxidase (laccase) domain-containing protein